MAGRDSVPVGAEIGTGGFEPQAGAEAAWQRQVVGHQRAESVRLLGMERSRSPVRELHSLPKRLPGGLRAFDPGWEAQGGNEAEQADPDEDDQRDRVGAGAEGDDGDKDRARNRGPEGRPQV